MDNLVTWLIIIAFYAPLHYLLPVLVLFIIGAESEELRKRLIRHALIDSTLSMAGAFGIAIHLAEQEKMSAAMLILLISMAYPFIGIWRHRREFAHVERC
jgi:spore maturation protein SpmB